MTNTTQEPEPEVVSTNHVTLEREITVKDIGALITTTIEADDGFPAVIRVVDDFPGEDAIIEAQFDPDYEPMHASIEPSQVLYEHAVPRDETVTIKYGVRLETPELATRLPPPRIDFAEPIDDTTGDVSLADAGAARLGNSADGSLADADDARGDQSGGATSESSEPSSTDWGQEATDGWGEARSMQSTTETEPDPGVWGEEVENQWEGADPTNVDQQEPSDRSPAGGTHAVEFDAQNSILTRLISELRDADLSEDQRAVLRQELQLDPPKSMDVRLRHIQSQMNEFDSYADTLEEFIDRYGSPEEFADGLTNDQADIEDALARLDAEVPAAGEDRSAIRQSLEEAIDEVESLRGQLKAEIAAAREEVHEQHGSLDDELGSIESDVTSTESKLDDLDHEITDLESQFEDEVGAMDRELEASVAELKEWMSDELGGLAERVANNDGDIAEEVDSLERRLENRIDELHAELAEDLNAFRGEIEGVQNDFESTMSSIRSEVRENTAARRQFAKFVEHIRSLGLDPEEAGLED